MRIRAYLRVLSNEATICALHSETSVPHSSIKKLKARRGKVGDDMCWNWQTEPVPIDMENPDDGFRALLLAHKPILPIIKRHQGPETDIYLEVVTQYEKGGEPRGLYLSAETILLQSEMGGAFDNALSETPWHSILNLSAWFVETGNLKSIWTCTLFPRT